MIYYTHPQFHDVNFRFSDEIFLPIEGKPSYYISNYGRILSLVYENRIMKPSRYRGYLSIPELGKVHRLVANAFIPNPENKPEVNHINFDPSDNRASNLEWCTSAENMQHSANNGRLGKPQKLTESDVIEIINSKLTRKEISEIYDIAATTVHKIKNGQIWKHITKDSNT